MNILQRGAVKLIRLYQKCFSPQFPASCRFYPTCSSYTLGAIQIHGFFKGCLLGIWRILRCNHFSAGGIDPVPGSELAKRLAEEQAADQVAETAGEEAEEPAH